MAEHKFFVPVIKTDKDKRIITGVVLEPDTFDAQETTISSPVIEKAAHGYIVKLVEKSAKIGVQHNDFTKKFQLLETWIAPQDLVIGTKVVKAGSWVVSMKVISDSVWKKIKNGKITGFSIGGKAKIKMLAA